jgi:serine/threonine-protein kinase
MYVSSGPQQVTVPNVVNMTQSAATSALEGAGFHVQVQQAASSPGKSGKVIAQDPPAGTEADKNSTVTITVGSGPPTSSTT